MLKALRLYTHTHTHTHTHTGDLQNEINYKKENGITLVALVVTIIILLILATISIQALTSTGLFENANKAKLETKRNQIKEWLSLNLMEAQTTSYDKTDSEILEIAREKAEKSEELKKLGKSVSVDGELSTEEDGQTVPTYFYVIVDNDVYKTDIKGAEFIGELGNLPPVIKIESISSTINSIIIKVKTSRNKGGKLEYYIKAEDEENYKLKETKTDDTEYIFEGLIQGKKYNIKVIAKAENGEQTYVITDSVMVQIERGIFVSLNGNALNFFNNEEEARKNADTIEHYYGNILNSHYTSNGEIPWKESRETISTIRFANKIEPITTSYWFYSCVNLNKIENLENLDTNNDIDMKAMFYGCESLLDFNLSSLNTANVTDMSHMFEKCKSFTNLDLTSFNTSKVTNMGSMFALCEGLQYLNLSSFDTRNVITMCAMFSNSKNLAIIDIDKEKFITDKLANMSWMFTGCESLKQIDFSNFNTSNATDMQHMFEQCKSFTRLDLTSFDTSKVTNMESMFAGCEKLEYLNLSSFDTRNVITMGAMFGNSKNLVRIDIDKEKFITDKLVNMSWMFTGCENLKQIDFSNFNTSDVTDMSHMFEQCKSFTNLDLTSFDTSKVTNMGSMFAGCENLEYLDLSSFNTKNTTMMGSMFAGNSKLNKIYIGDDWITSQAETIYMFNDCKSDILTHR